MNKIILSGRLTADPTITTSSNGEPICRFSLAVRKTQEEANFFNIVCFKKTADTCGKFLRKGRRTIVCGRLETRSFVGKDNVKHFVTEILADEVEFLDNNEQTNEKEEQSGELKKILQPISDEDLPF